ncbi:MAG TPA: xylose isomerase [Candidatus Angelobacter sp.]|nr:xylose isomerase [Candidatus Angelobacter sp.]
MNRTGHKPILRHIANLWTLLDHPWSLDEKLRAFKDAGFDGVCWAGSPELRAGCQKHGLIFVGGMASGNATDFSRLLQEQKDCGAIHVNVQLASDDVLTPEGLELALALNREGKRVDVIPGIETHRGTCTETPEKHYALCDAYQKATGELLPLSIDFSHFAVVKHLVPENFAKRLLVRPDLIQHAQQFHFRPFNGHHAQVPVTDGKGNLTREFEDWLPFAEALLQCWLDGNRDKNREIFICPELGPITGGYCLSTFHDSWEDKKLLRQEIDALWRKLTD